jgi:DMSO/TMAO reductase YedYZ molybdopterin-dependent catalytic subunit
MLCAGYVDNGEKGAGTLAVLNKTGRRQFPIVRLRWSSNNGDTRIFRQARRLRRNAEERRQAGQAWNWTELKALPQTKTTRDIHCVTTWSKFDTR